MLTIVDKAGPALEAVRAGAFHYIVKPFDRKELLNSLKNALSGRGGSAGRLSFGVFSEGEGSGTMVGRSPVMLALYRRIRDVAALDTNILVSGETGTGKELIARTIHESGPRRRGPFVPLNCAAISTDLAKSELFGHERGAFTGAFSTHKGKFEQAHEGTLFLDEIGTMPLSVQAKLLRVLEDRLVTKIGSEKTVEVDLRVIAATNVDLLRAVAEGGFREDLYYRLSAIHLKAPPLRERGEDVNLLIRHFVLKHRGMLPRPVPDFSPRVLEILRTLPWKGNVRELENTILALLCSRRQGRIEPEDLPAEMLVPSIGTGPQGRSPETRPFLEQIESSEKTIIRDALHKANNNRVKAARLLDIHESTLYRKMKKYGLK
jgi:DNA-binding NtrC family response regulator